MLRAALWSLAVGLLSVGCLADPPASSSAPPPGSCSDGDSRVCGKAVGVCFIATQRCVQGAWEGCPGEAAAGPEACDGIDNDCNGRVDDAPGCADVDAGLDAGRDTGRGDPDAERPDGGAPVLASTLRSPECQRLVLGGGTPERVPADSLWLGALLPLSGPLAEIGDGMRAAAELAVEELHAAGGVHGRPCGLLVCDSALDGQTARAALRHMAGLPGAQRVVGVVGPATSSVTLDVVSSAVELDLLLASPSATAPRLATVDDGGLLWRVAPSDRRQAEAMGALLAATQRARVAVLLGDDEFSASMFEALVETLRARSPVGDEPRVDSAEVPGDVGEDRLQAVAGLVADGEPDALVVLLPEATGSRALRALAAEGVVGPAGPPLLLAESLRSEAVGAALAGAGASAAALGVRPSPPVGPQYAAFVQRYRARYGDDPGVYAAHAYDAAYLLALATLTHPPGVASGRLLSRGMGLTSAGPPVAPGRAAVGDARAAVATAGSLDYQGASGSLDWSAEEREAPGSVLAWRFVRGVPVDGEVVYDEAGQLHVPEGWDER